MLINLDEYQTMLYVAAPNRWPLSFDHFLFQTTQRKISVHFGVSEVDHFFINLN